MAKHVLYDAFVSVNGTDLSDHVESVSYVVGINPQPAAAMSEVQDYDMPGTQTVSPITCTFYSDFAASELYATLKGLYTARSTFTLIVKPTSGADSATNPALTISAFLATFPIVSGTRGERHMSACVFQPAGLMTFDES